MQRVSGGSNSLLNYIMFLWRKKTKIWQWHIFDIEVTHLAFVKSFLQHNLTRTSESIKFFLPELHFWITWLISNWKVLHEKYLWSKDILPNILDIQEVYEVQYEDPDSHFNSRMYHVSSIIHKTNHQVIARPLSFSSNCWWSLYVFITVHYIHYF